MVRLIAQRGPRVDEISRVMGVHNETVRHWYKQLLNRGFIIQASCNYESLGMKRIIAIVELESDFRRVADMVFYVMSESAYLTGYAKTRHGGLYILNSSVPEECVADWTHVMLQMKKLGMFSSIHSITLDWVRNVPMRADEFDFRTGKWKFSLKKRRPIIYRDETPSQRQKYDTVDLKIIGQLQLDANMSLTDMCDKVGGMNYKTFTWHFREHVFRRHLIKGYRVNWVGMTYGSRHEGQSRRQKYSWVDVVADSLSEVDRLQLASKLNVSPFLWIEGSGLRTYYSRMVFPPEHAAHVLELLRRTTSSTEGHIRWFRMNPSRSIYFSMETACYDEENHRWSLDREHVMETFESLSKLRRQPTSAVPVEPIA